MPVMYKHTKTKAYKNVAFVREGANFDLNIKERQNGRNTWSYAIEERPEARKTETLMKFINCNLWFENSQ